MIFRDWIEWVLRIFQAMMVCAKPTQPYLPALRRALKESLDKDEKKELGRSCIKIKGLLDYAISEEEDEEEAAA